MTNNKNSLPKLDKILAEAQQVQGSLKKGKNNFVRLSLIN
jgi:hypothetical protein